MFVDLVKKNLLNAIQTALLEKWLASKEQEMLTKALARARTKEKERLEQEANNKYSYKLSKVANPPLTVEIQGYHVLTRYEYEFRVSEYNTYSDVKKEYRETFQNSIWAELKILFDNAIDALQPQKAEEKLMARHPWLSGKTSNASLPYQFLYSYLENRLLKTLSSPLLSWSEVKVSDMEGRHFKWTAFSEEWLDNYADSFPFQKIYSKYMDDYRSEYLSQHLINNTDNTNGLQRIRTPLSRIDVFRFLYNQSYSSMTTPDELTITQNAPLHVSELEKLKPAHWQVLRNMVVNFGNEHSPIWGFIRKTDTGWTAYLPPSYEKYNDLLRAIPDLKDITFASVSFKDNLNLNDVGEISEATTAWHAVLFGRVIPWSFKTNPGPLANFRDRVPLPVLHQRVLEQCMEVSANPGYALKEIKNAGRNRKPFSDFSWPELNPLPTKKQPNYLLGNSAASDFIEMTDVLSGFDEGELGFSSDLTTFSIKLNFYYKAEDRLTQALHMVYHHAPTRLLMPSIKLSTTNKELFNYDTNLRTVRPNNPKDFDKSNFSYPMHCAARNRLLEQTRPAMVQADKVTIASRKVLWREAGNAIALFFQNHGDAIDLDFMNQVDNFNRKWRASYCDHDLRQSVSSPLWSFVQIAQMGKEGLDELFSVLQAYSGNPEQKEPSPNSPCAFDLNGSMTDEPFEYIAYLTEKIKNYHPKSAGHAPLFKTLSLILPDNLDNQTVEALMRLISVLDERKKSFPNEVSEVKLYNLKNPSLQSAYFINTLLTKARANDLQVQIDIPAWNREAYTQRDAQTLKATYRQLQNTILENQRTVRHKNLVDNTASIYLCADKKLDPVLILDSKLSQQPQSWDGDDVLYPLTAQTPGIQQQLQQEVGQEFQAEQEQQQEQEQEQEQEQQIMQFYGDESQLITRDNIDEKGKKNWEALNPEIKGLSGWDNKTLKQLFSLWVGSHDNAPQVIEKIHPNAVQKIMAHAPQFRMGIAKDNLPAGFFLQYSHNKGLILCFDELRERRELRAENQKPLKERNPFTLGLYAPRAVCEWGGDFRQWDLLNKDTITQQTFWQHLATEDKDKVRLENAMKLSNSDDATTASVMAQHIDIFAKNSKPENYQQCLNYLNLWSKPFASRELRTALFEKGETVLSEKDLRAFGQIVNHYDIHSNRVNGSGHFLFLAGQILKEFGESGFKVWKKRFLEMSANWSEYLEKSEVDAIALSITTLRGFPRHQALWWKLVDAHGKAVGHIRYADLWYAFQKVLAYVEDRNLTLDEKCWNHLLETSENFNAKVFLDRLYRVLKNQQNQLDSHSVQQLILNHLHQIDWRHNGFYYASRYQNYPYWDERMAFSDFSSTTKARQAGYPSVWDLNFELQYPAIHALRFASKRMQLSQKQFLTLKALLNENLTYKQSQAIRLFMASISVGVNSLGSFTPEEFEQTLTALAPLPAELLQWMNEAVPLDRELLLGTLRMRFQDIPVFAEIIGPTWKSIESLKDRIDFINASGRALHCFNRLGEQAVCFRQLMDFSQKEGFNHPLFTTYPWLINEKLQSSSWAAPSLAAYKMTAKEQNIKQLALFEKQLQSIDFENNSYWPNTRELEEFFNQIAQSSNPLATRKQVIAQLLRKQCAITFQDAPFRPLDAKEIEKSLAYLDSHLRPGFKNRNLELAKRFLEEYAAVKADTDAVQQAERLFRLVARLDNKAHFDEVGQVLGTLISAARKNQKRRYSLPQLASWLDALVDEKTLGQQHYPVNLLQVILEEALSSESSLLHSDLNQLKENDRKLHQQRVNEMVQEPLPNQYKPVLVKLLLENTDGVIVKEAQKALGLLHECGASSGWMNAVTHFLSVSREPHFAKYRLLPVFTQHANQVFKEESEEFKLLWQKTQVKLIELTINRVIAPEVIYLYFTQYNAKQAYIKVILLQALHDWNKEGKFLINVHAKLQNLEEEQLRQLAHYYGSDPRPSLEMLHKLLAKPELNTTKAIIHHFESVEQGVNELGLSKRHYSLSNEDRKGLMRVLAGFKRKGQPYLEDAEQKELINLLYYVNNFSQAASLHQLEASELTETLYRALEQLKNNAEPIDKHQASARVLACMREILLRKSGKWANHTQMISLLYAALYNDESLLHQVRTGQGKSIITVMRSAYLALNDYVVDVFSSKDSLSQRDHEEFAPVLDAMGIQHAYITENSPAEGYKTRSAEGVGAINYATIGNFSLFHSRHIWGGQQAIELDPKRRAAWLDEADYILRFEQTQFNYSDNTESDPIYNMDEWVYRATYDWYLLNRDKFHQLKETGIVAVSRKEHLQPLCDYLQQQIICSPKQSHFFDKYINPALSKDEQTLKKRDRQLKQLLTAAHIATNLNEGTDFCIRPDSKTVAGGLVINTRAGKVVISNQIRHGSTYSDLVQQFLHIRLSKEATRRGEAPDFFVEPDTQIALSQNAPYLLKKYYSKLEGCTGTAGNAAALRLYKEEYGIEHVSKLPTHEEIRTTFEPMIFCFSEEEQTKVISDLMVRYKDQPILHACKDDPTVKRLSQKIRTQLANHEDYDMSRFLVDTNDSGKHESDILPEAGLNGAVSNSSRLGRGTDIKPQSEKGLVVIRSYPADPDIEKQERGRQGRNGAKGLCIDVIDYSAIEKTYDAYMDSPHRNRLQALLRDQQQHIEHRLQKHSFNGSQKWDWLREEEVQKKYIVTRAVVQLNSEIKHEREKFLRRKEYLIATLSGEVMDQLHTAIRNKDNSAHSRLRTAWLEHRKQIEEAWNGRLAGKQGDSEEVYAEFFKQADGLWQRLCIICPQLDTLCLLPLTEKTADMAEGAEGLLKYLEKQQELWQDKLSNGKLSKEDLPALTQLKAKLKRLALEWHPDKLDKSSMSPNDITLSGDLINHINTLQKLRGDCEYELEQREKILNPDVGNKNESMPEMPLNGVSGAMVLHRPGYRHVPKKQKGDMVNVVTFYQEWIKGSKNHYFESIASTNERQTLLEAVYGPNHQYLNAFYQELKVASSDIVSEERSSLLFTQLTSIIKQHKSAFSVSSEAWTKVIKLFRKGNPEQDGAFFDALNTFFGQSWINQKEAIRLGEDNIVKNSVLLAQVMKIVATAYVSENDASRKFIRNFCEVIHNDFWDSFPYLSEIADVLASHPKVTRLLTIHSNKNDIGQLLQLIKSYHLQFLLASLGGEEAAQKSREQIKTLLSYLDEQADHLMASPAQIRPLLTILLSKSYPGYLPKANVLSHLSQSARGSFWYFLSQRIPLVEKACEELIDNLAGFEEEEFEQKIIQPLVKLPSYLPLEYINRELKYRPGCYQFDDAQAVIEEMHAAGLAFNEFLAKRNMIASSSRFITPVQTEVFQQWVSYFVQIPAGKAKDLFKMLKKHEVPEKALSQLVGVYCNRDAMSLEIVEDYLKTLEHLEKVKPHSEKFNFLSQVYQVLLMSVDTAKIKEFKSFAQLMENTPADLTTHEMNTLWDIWQKRNDQDLLRDSVELIKQLKSFDKSYPAIRLTEKYLRLAIDPLVNQLYNDFLQVINANKNKGLDKEGNEQLPMMESLVEAYFDKKTIQSKQQLTIAFDVVREAKQLNQNQQWKDYFSQVACKKQKQRQQMMQYLHHGLLNLGDDFSKKCYHEYKNLSAEVVLNVPQKLGDNQQGRSQLRHCFNQLIHFTRELVEVAKHPFIDIPQRGSEHENDEDFMEERKAYFAKQQQKYASFWWTTNKVREGQARNLFLSLNARVENKEEFYQHSLQALWQAQHDILERDKGTQYNKKGYSRLYDMTMQMFLKIAGDLLADNDIALGSKIFLNTILNEQTRVHVETLYERLPEKSALKGAMTALITQASEDGEAWAPGSVELSKLNRLLVTHAASVPKPLHYLIKNLECLIQIPASESPRPLDLREANDLMIRR